MMSFICCLRTYVMLLLWCHFRKGKYGSTHWGWDRMNWVLPTVFFNAIFNTLRPRQNGRHFADDTFSRIFVNKNVRISIKFSLKFVTKGPINNIPALVQIMAWRRPGDKPLSEPVMVSLLTHIYVTRPQWVNEKLIISTKISLKFVPVCPLSNKPVLVQEANGNIITPSRQWVLGETSVLDKPNAFGCSSLWHKTFITFKNKQDLVRVRKIQS